MNGTKPPVERGNITRRNPLHLCTLRHAIPPTKPVWTQDRISIQFRSPTSQGGGIRPFYIRIHDSVLAAFESDLLVATPCFPALGVVAVKRPKSAIAILNWNRRLFRSCCFVLPRNETDWWNQQRSS